MSNKTMEPIWFPKNTTIVDGTIYYKEVTNPEVPTEYVGPLKLSQLKTQYGFGLTAFTETYQGFDLIEFTDIRLQSGLNSVIYDFGPSHYIKFNVQYPDGLIKEVIFKLFGNIPV